MPYVDLNGLHNPATGTVPPVTWGDQIRTNFEYFASPPMCALAGYATTFGSNVLTLIDAQIEVYDTDGMHVGTNDWMTVITPGKYLCCATVQWDVNATGARLLELYVNSVDRYTIQQITAVGGGLTTVQNGTQILNLVAGDTIAIRGRQVSGGNLDCTLFELSAIWIGR